MSLNKQLGPAVRRVGGSVLRRYPVTPILRLALFLLTFTVPVHAATYYMSPSGNDSNTGISAAVPWATFNRAWQSLFNGDTLILLDGTYFQTLRPNMRNGRPGSPITVRAQNDGRAIIDGQNVRTTVHIGDTWTGVENPVGHDFVIEGIVAKNSSEGVFSIIHGDNNVLRRVSGYNANTNGNDHVFLIWGNDNLLEDCAAGGSGRKMIVLYGGGASESERNIVRRCFTAWQEWQGADFNPGQWPWGDSIETYNASYNLIENSISFGMSPGPGAGIEVFAQSGATATGNAVLGSMAIRAGMKMGGAQMDWPCPSPYNLTQPSCTDFAGNWGMRAGVRLGNNDGSIVRNNLFQDIFSWGNGGFGFFVDLGAGNPNQLVRGTILHNGLDTSNGQQNRSINDPTSTFPKFSTLQDTYVEGTTQQGSGAVITHRYQSSFNGNSVVPQLTNVPLWPWPMEDRIRTEFTTHLTAFHGLNPELVNFSVTNTMMGIFNSVPTALNPVKTGIPPSSPCDVNGTEGVNVSDVQLCANQAIGAAACTTGDINGDEQCTVVDVQRVVNAALGGACVTQ